MNKEYLVVDSGGFVMAHFAGRAQSFEGLHYASALALPLECKKAVEELLNEAGAGERHENRAIRRVLAADSEYEIRLVEAIRVERSECDLKRALMESLFLLSQQAQESRARLAVKVSAGFPNRVLIDSDKIIWATNSLIRAALFETKKGSILRAGGKVDVEISYDTPKNLMSVTVEGDIPAKDELGPRGATIGQNSAAGKLVRAIVEAHGGILIWQDVPMGKRMGTRVSITVPAL